MKKVTSAGGIIIRHNPHKQILLTIYTHIQGLGFPKGHVEEGETFEQAALREVTEETGLTELKITKYLGMYSREATEKGGLTVLKDIYLYLMESAKPNFHQEAEEEYDWFDIDHAIEKMASNEDKEFLISIVNSI